MTHQHRDGPVVYLTGSGATEAEARAELQALVAEWVARGHAQLGYSEEWFDDGAHHHRAAVTQEARDDD